MPGIDIQAQVVEHLLTGKFLERPDYALALEQAIILALGIMLALALPRVSANASAAIGFFSIALVLAGGWAAFRYGNLLIDSVVIKDVNTAMAIVTLLIFLVLTINLIIDLSLPLIDPRVKFES